MTKRAFDDSSEKILIDEFKERNLTVLRAQDLVEKHKHIEKLGPKPLNSVTILILSKMPRLEEWIAKYFICYPTSFEDIRYNDDFSLWFEFVFGGCPTFQDFFLVMHYFEATPAVKEKLLEYQAIGEKLHVYGCDNNLILEQLFRCGNELRGLFALDKCLQQSKISPSQTQTVQEWKKNIADIVLQLKVASVGSEHSFVLSEFCASIVQREAKKNGLYLTYCHYKQNVVFLILADNDTKRLKR